MSDAGVPACGRDAGTLTARMADTLPALARGRGPRELVISMLMWTRHLSTKASTASEIRAQIRENIYFFSWTVTARIIPRFRATAGESTVGNVSHPNEWIAE